MEGQRVAKSKGGGKLPVIAAGAAAGVLAAAYLGICAWAAGQDVILPNVSVAGIDVSSMTVEQARDTVRTAADQAGQDVTLTLAYEDLEKTAELRRFGAGCGAGGGSGPAGRP
ncbi:hypothetical protein [Lawsonibacter sp. JLR.KK007]|uniref:hypothetical protein n=1 Tax=Lawsonibacter sp. JLR.KK007 TaxID=3114293 RepID=UPI002FF09B24